MLDNRSIYVSIYAKNNIDVAIGKINIFKDNTSRLQMILERQVIYCFAEMLHFDYLTSKYASKLVLFIQMLIHVT